MASSSSSTSLPPTSSHITKAAQTRSIRSLKGFRRTASQSSSVPSVADNWEDDDAWRCGSDDEDYVKPGGAHRATPTVSQASQASQGSFWDFAFGSSSSRAKEKGKQTDDPRPALHGSSGHTDGPPSTEPEPASSSKGENNSSTSFARNASTTHATESSDTPGSASASWVQVMPAGTKGKAAQDAEPVVIEGRRRSSTSKNEMARAVREDIDDLVNGMDRHTPSHSLFLIVVTFITAEPAAALRRLRISKSGSFIVMDYHKDANSGPSSAEFVNGDGPSSPGPSSGALSESIVLVEDEPELEGQTAQQTAAKRERRRKEKFLQCLGRDSVDLGSLLPNVFPLMMPFD
jgi:hypothetical protein